MGHGAWRSEDRTGVIELESYITSQKSDYLQNASDVDYWIPAFAGMTKERPDDARHAREGGNPAQWEDSTFYDTINIEICLYRKPKFPSNKLIRGSGFHAVKFDFATESRSHIQYDLYIIYNQILEFEIYLKFGACNL